MHEFFIDLCSFHNMDILGKFLGIIPKKLNFWGILLLRLLLVVKH